MSSRVGSKVGRRTARGWLSGTVSLAVILGMGLASAPPASAEDDEDLVVTLGQKPLGAVVDGVWDNALVADDGRDWYTSSDRGSTWRVVDASGIGNAYRLEAIDGQYAVLSGSTADDDSTALVWLVKHSSEVPSVTSIELPDADLRAADATTAIAVIGGETRAIDLATKTETVLKTQVEPGSWWELDAAQSLQVDVTYASDGMTPVSSAVDPTPMDGSTTGDAPFTVPGGVYDIAYDAAGIEYLTFKKTTGRTTFEFEYCTRATGATVSFCDVLKSGISKADSYLSTLSRVGNFAQLQIGKYLYAGELVRDARTGKVPAAKKVTGVGINHYPDGTETRFAFAGRSAHPIVSDTTAGTGGIFEVPASGKATRFSAGPTGPAEPDQLSLSATRMAGVDGRGTGTAWQRDLSAPDDEQIVSRHGLQARVSVGRTAVNGTDGLVLTDQSKQVAKLAKWVNLGELSGPYLLGQATRKAKKATVLAGSRAITFGKWDYPMALFGSRVAALTFGDDDWWITIFDVAGGKPVQVETVSLADFQDVSSIWMWGDSVIVCGKEDAGADGDQVVTTNFVTGDVASKSFADGATVAGLGDGVAVIQTGDRQGWQVMNTATGALVPLDGSGDAAPAVDGANHVLYATDSSLVLHEVPFAGTSAPRALWTSAATTFNSWAGESAPWKLSVDATRAVGAGSLVITGAAVTEPLSVLVDASADGSLRVSWDGKLADGTWAPAGSYSWELTGFDGLRDIADADPVKGDLTVSNKAVAFPQAAPVIDNTKPVTDAVLTVSPGAKPSDGSAAYQWYRGTKAISGATAATYTVAAVDLGKTLKVKVSFAGSTHYLPTSKYSASTKKVATATLTKGTVALDDTTPQVGIPVSAVLGGWGPDPVATTFKWYRVDAKNKATAISGASKASYTPVAADAAYRLKVTATVTRPGYAGASLTSAVSEPTQA